MIQVLAENCGVIGGDGENNSGKKFKQWLKNMGQFIVPGSAVGKKESITTLINAYAQSARAYKVKMRKDNRGRKMHRFQNHISLITMKLYKLL